MYNICKNTAQQTIRFLTSVLDNINLNINILYSNFSQLYLSISNYGIMPDQSYFISGSKLYEIILIYKKKNRNFITIIFIIFQKSILINTLNKNQKSFLWNLFLSTTSHTSSISTQVRFLLALYYKTTRHSTTEYYG